LAFSFPLDGFLLKILRTRKNFSDKVYFSTEKKLCQMLFYVDAQKKGFFYIFPEENPFLCLFLPDMRCNGAERELKYGEDML
jgi:hypothetical protein